MKSIKKLILLVLFIYSASYANTLVVERKKLPLSQSLPLLKSIDKHAMHIGRGAVDVYVFIDPHCPRSQEFITLISQNMKMQSIYHYHIFLYELKRFKTKALIEAIYASRDPKNVMIRIMVDKKIIKKDLLKDKKSLKTVRKIEAIKSVAGRIDVYKRPYLVLVKKRKK